MDVSADLDWGFDLKQHRLLHEDVPDYFEEACDLCFGEVDQPSWLVSADLEESANDVVDVYFLFGDHLK